MKNLVVPVQSGDYQENAWEGVSETKPWQYAVQLVIPHLGWVDPLRVALDLWQRQTIKPYVCIVDTGSEWKYLETLESLRSENVEVHYLRAHGYRHPSEPVSVAIDFASSRCQQTYQFQTHGDVFPMRRDLIESFVAVTNKEQPVAGYEISGRSHVPGAMKILWPGMVGHTATCIHFPTIRDLGITWSLDRGFSQFSGINREERTDTDTEIPFNMHLRAVGITPVILGKDKNWVRDKNEDFDHCRSFTSSALYSAGHFSQASEWIRQAMEDANQRAKEWDDASVRVPESSGEYSGKECLRDRECGCRGG